MATVNQGERAFTATAAALSEGQRVKIDAAGLMLVAGAAEASVGVLTEDVVASGRGNVALWGGRSWKVVTSGAVAAGARLQLTAAGAVDDTAANSSLIAFEAASASGSLIEVGRTDQDFIV